MFDNNNFRYDVLKSNFDCDDLRTLQVRNFIYSVNMFQSKKKL